MNIKLASLLTGAALAVTIISTGTAAAYAPHANVSSRITTAALVPFAMQVFCAKDPSQCATGSGATQATSSDDLIAVLHQVNRRVNRAIKPRSDGADTWEVGSQYGDCEDYVLTKRAQLIRQGVPSGSLRVAFTHTSAGEAHAILVVKTSNGDYVLDNLSNQIRSVRASGYRIRTMSSSDPTRWIAG